MRLKGKYPLKLLAVPDDPIPGDERAGKALRAGYFLFRGTKQPLASLDFSNLDLAPAFVDYIHSFRWLRDLSMVTTREQAAPIAEALLRKWLAVHAEKPRDPAGRRDNDGQRMMFRNAVATTYLLSPAS